jgi:hypothetical protein
MAMAWPAARHRTLIWVSFHAVAALRAAGGVDRVSLGSVGRELRAWGTGRFGAVGRLVYPLKGILVQATYF